MNLFSPLSVETRRILDGIPALIDQTFPLPDRFRSGLPAEVAELSRLLTSGKGERSLSYLGRPNVLSAYLRYFLPWNLYRLCVLLPALDISLVAHNAVTDLGCGPLTLAAALWICKPELRRTPLEFRCIDRCGPALDAGKRFFHALAGDACPWKLRTIKADIHTAASVAGGGAALICAINVFNEIYSRVPHSDSDALREAAAKAASLLAGFAATGGKAAYSIASEKNGNANGNANGNGNAAHTGGAMLIVEPGTPQSGQFISLLRSALIERNLPPCAPCPHHGPCPLPGGKHQGEKARWCHFAFETEDAPKPLHRLSAAAGIPKERAVLSFLLAGCVPAASPQTTPPGSVRIISDAFPLPQNRMGRYGCSQQGLILAAGEKRHIKKLASGQLVSCQESGLNNQRDPKSGALVLDVTG